MSMVEAWLKHVPHNIESGGGMLKANESCGSMRHTTESGGSMQPINEYCESIQKTN